MNDPVLSEAMPECVDKACDAFEGAWQGLFADENRPRIEDFLKGVDTSDQPQLLRELVLVDLHYRRLIGESVGSDEYHQRFDDLDEAWIAHVMEQDTPEQSRDSSTPGQSLGSTVSQRKEGRRREESGSLRGGALEVGAQFGDYDLMEEIGRGGMGVVFRARQGSADREVALKVIRGDRIHAMPEEHRSEWLDRFRTEARATAQIEHEHVLSVFDVGEIDGSPYYSMRYIKGCSLADELRDQPLSDRDTAAYIEPIARAVHEAHQHGILHRDLKPRNILVDSNEHVYVADFGLAKLLDSEDDMTRAGDWLGTPGYMSPEQAQDSAKATVASDVYGLGATLYALLTGRPPFRGTSILDTLKQVQESAPESPKKLNPNVHRDMETICLKCLEKDPAKRYRSAAEAAGELARFTAGFPIQARRISRLARLWRWCRRKPVIAALLASVVAVALVGAGGVVWQWRRAVASAQEARSNLSRALEAIDFTGRAVGEVQLDAVPRMEKVRNDILENALGFHKALLEENRQDRTVRFETAKSHQRAGSSRRQLGKTNEAEQAYRNVIRLSEQLHGDHPDTVEYYLLLIEGWNHLGNLFIATDRMAEAEQAYGRLERLLAEPPPGVDTDQLRYTQAVFYGNQAYRLSAMQRYGDSEPFCREAIRLTEQLLKEAPDNRDHLDMLAGNYNSLAVMLRHTERIDEAKDVYRQAIDLFERLVSDRTDDPLLRVQLGTCYRNLGLLHRLTKAYDEACEAYREAEKIIAPLVQDFPYTNHYHHELAETLHGWALTLLDGERPEDLPECRELMERTIAHRRITLEPNPDHPMFKTKLRNILFALTELELRLGEHQSAFEHISQGALLADRPVDFLVMSHYFARCVQLAEQDEDLAAATRRELIDRYVEKAVEIMRSGAQQGLVDSDGLATDPEIEPLRSQVEFQKLLEEVGSVSAVDDQSESE